MPNNDWVFWLNLTNIALGVVVLLAMVIVAYGVIWELVSRHRKTHGLPNLDDELNAMLENEFAHSLQVPGVGMTMADGGERAGSSPAQEEKPKRH
jgi:hypothetical protein